MEKNIEYFKKLKEDNNERYIVERDKFITMKGTAIKVELMVTILMLPTILYIIMRNMDSINSDSAYLIYGGIGIFVVAIIGIIVGILTQQDFKTYRYLKEEKRNG